MEAKAEAVEVASKLTALTSLVQIWSITTTISFSFFFLIFFENILFQSKAEVANIYQFDEYFWT